VRESGGASGDANSAAERGDNSKCNSSPKIGEPKTTPRNSPASTTKSESQPAARDDVSSSHSNLFGLYPKYEHYLFYTEHPVVDLLGVMRSETTGKCLSPKHMVKARVHVATVPHGLWIHHAGDTYEVVNHQQIDAGVYDVWCTKVMKEEEVDSFFADQTRLCVHTLCRDVLYDVEDKSESQEIVHELVSSSYSDKSQSREIVHKSQSRSGVRGPVSGPHSTLNDVRSALSQSDKGTRRHWGWAAQAPRKYHRALCAMIRAGLCKEVARRVSHLVDEQPDKVRFYTIVSQMGVTFLPGNLALLVSNDDVRRVSHEIDRFKRRIRWLKSMMIDVPLMGIPCDEMMVDRQIAQDYEQWKTLTAYEQSLLQSNIRLALSEKPPDHWKRSPKKTTLKSSHGSITEGDDHKMVRVAAVMIVISMVLLDIAISPTTMYDAVVIYPVVSLMPLLMLVQNDPGSVINALYGVQAPPQSMSRIRFLMKFWWWFWKPLMTKENAKRCSWLFLLLLICLAALVVWMAACYTIHPIYYVLSEIASHYVGKPWKYIDVLFVNALIPIDCTAYNFTRRLISLYPVALGGLREKHPIIMGVIVRFFTAVFAEELIQMLLCMAGIHPNPGPPKELSRKDVKRNDRAEVAKALAQERKRREDELRAEAEAAAVRKAEEDEERRKKVDEAYITYRAQTRNVEENCEVFPDFGDVKVRSDEGNGQWGSRAYVVVDGQLLGKCDDPELYDLIEKKDEVKIEKERQFRAYWAPWMKMGASFTKTGAALGLLLYYAVVFYVEYNNDSIITDGVIVEQFFMDPTIPNLKEFVNMTQDVSMRTECLLTSWKLCQKKVFDVVEHHDVDFQVTHVCTGMVKDDRDPTFKGDELLLPFRRMTVDYTITRCSLGSKEIIEQETKVGCLNRALLANVVPSGNLERDVAAIRQKLKSIKVVNVPFDLGLDTSAEYTLLVANVCYTYCTTPHYLNGVPKQSPVVFGGM